MKLSQRFLFLILSFCSSVYADSIPQWDIIPAESSISFTGTQNNAPVTGAFKSFKGTIQVDPAKPESATLDFIINMDSLSVSYADLANILITPEWFDVKAFPTAEFKSNKINKIDEQHYTATGVLTIKNKSQPVVLKFTAVESPKDHGVVEGSTIIKRSAFGVGSGEWASTDTVKDEVIVSFKVAASRKK
ncbi:MAG: YceI family protein [Legionella sp.]|uniref:YceI family protein n=1 Tax=Legionella sp. TaxID=459 RepID=UPI00283B742F|nr:YceI family protein [Legionella sp.]